MTRTLLIGGLLLALLLAYAWPTAAQPSSDYRVTWYTIETGSDSLGDPTTGYGIIGTAAQPDTAILGSLTTGYGVRGGFWQALEGVAPAVNRYYLPIIGR